MSTLSTIDIKFFFNKEYNEALLILLPKAELTTILKLRLSFPAMCAFLMDENNIYKILWCKKNHIKKIT